MNRNVTATILIVLSIGIYATYTRNVLTNASEIKSVNDQYASAIDNASKLIARRDQVLKSYNNISANDRDRLDKMIPNTVDNIRLIIDLSNVALQHGFSLKNISATTDSSSGSASGQGQAVNPSASSPSGNPLLSIAIPTLDTVDVSFSATAPYNQFISFMQDLEASLRIIDAAHVTLTANDTGTYDYSVKLTTYWLRQ